MSAPCAAAEAFDAAPDTPGAASSWLRDGTCQVSTDDGQGAESETIVVWLISRLLSLNLNLSFSIKKSFRLLLLHPHRPATTSSPQAEGSPSSLPLRLRG